MPLLNIFTIDELINKHVFLSSPDIDDIFDTNIVSNGEIAACHFSITSPSA